MGALGPRPPPGVTDGAPKQKESQSEKKDGRKTEKMKKWGKKERKGKSTWREGRQDKFKLKVGASGKKTSGAPN